MTKYIHVVNEQIPIDNRPREVSFYAPKPDDGSPRISIVADAPDGNWAAVISRVIIEGQIECTDAKGLNHCIKWPCEVLISPPPLGV